MNKSNSPANRQRLIHNALLPCLSTYFSPFLLILLFAIPPACQAQQDEFENARHLAVNGNHQAAESQLRELVQKHPDFLQARLLRAHNLSWGRQFDRAISEFQQLAREHPDNQEVLAGLGFAYAWSGDTPNAIHPFHRILRADPKNEEARKGLGHTYLISGNGEGGHHVFRELSVDYPGKPEYFIGQGHALLLLGQKKNARHAFKEALALDPANMVAKELLDRMQTLTSPIEIDAWAGYTSLDESSRYGLRFLQAYWQFHPRFATYARYDNSLSLDNVDFVARRANAASVWMGGFAAWNRKTASRLEYGLRFFPAQQTQHFFKAEQVFYSRSDINIKIGGFAGLSANYPIEWYGYTSLMLPLGQYFSIEPSYYYARQGNNPNAQHRASLSAKLRHPKGFELTIGRFYGKANIELVEGKDQITGGYAIALFPFSKIVWGQLAINYENGVFANSTVFAAGIKLKLER